MKSSCSPSVSGEAETGASACGGGPEEGEPFDSSLGLLGFLLE